MVIASKALRTLRYKLNKNYVQKGKTPYEDYNFIKKYVWEKFVEKNEYQRWKGQGREVLLARKEEHALPPPGQHRVCR
jgi:hypothetical protein